MEGGGVDLKHRKKHRPKKENEVDLIEQLFGTMGSIGKTERRPPKNPFEFTLKLTKKDDDTMGVKKPRKKLTQPPRPPSVRAQTVAKKALEKIQEVKKAVTKRPSSAPVKKAAVKKTQIKPDQYDTIKRTYTHTFKFSDNYMNEFSMLLNRTIPGLEESIRDENKDLNPMALNKLILDLHDSVYFELRDELLLSLGLRKRELDTMVQE